MTAANRHIVEEKAVLHISRGKLAYMIRAEARFMEVAGGYILLDDFKVTPTLPFELTYADKCTIIDALYKMSDKRAADSNPGHAS